MNYSKFEESNMILVAKKEYSPAKDSNQILITMRSLHSSTGYKFLVWIMSDAAERIPKDLFYLYNSNLLTAATLPSSSSIYSEMSCNGDIPIGSKFEPLVFIPLITIVIIAAIAVGISVFCLIRQLM